MNEKTQKYFDTLFFLFFAIILVRSNHFDWDHFLSFFEVERRSWLLNFEPPLWSYQACGGSSRIGDPQAFGLSPLFIFILVFGSFWGSKILSLFCAAVAYFSIPKILSLLFQNKSQTRAFRALGVFFIFGSYFLWHLHTGQITFGLSLFACLPLYMALKILRDDRSLTTALVFLVSMFCYLTAGFYHSLVFQILPLVLSGSIIAFLYLFFFPLGRNVFYKGLGRLGILLGLSLALASYKWWNVMIYQEKFPRDLSNTRIVEDAIDLFDLAQLHLLPIWNYEFIPSAPFRALYSIWEYSSFSALPYLAAAIFFLGLRHVRRRLTHSRAAVFALLVFTILVLVPISFLLGDDYFFSFHKILNEFVYHHSVRVIGRYLILLQIPLLLGIAYGITKSTKLESTFKRRLIAVGYLLTFFNLVSFLAMSLSQNPKYLDKLESREVAQMNKLHFTELRKLGSLPYESPFVAGESSMYPSILRGEIVLNCYQPLRRERKIATEKWLASGLSDYSPLVFESDSTECSSSASVSQNRIYFDRTHCRRNLCLNLNMINFNDSNDWGFDPDKQRYCLLK